MIDKHTKVTETTEKEALANTAAILGISNEDLINRVVDRIAHQAVSSMSFDDDGEGYEVEGPLARQLRNRTQSAIDRAVDKMAEETIVPKADELIKNFVIQETNRFGEPTKKAISFTEYIVNRADNWLNEGLDVYGKSKSQSRDSYFRESTTRFAYMIDEHISHRLGLAIKQMMEGADKNVKGGLKKLVIEALDKASASFTVEVVRKK